MKPLRAFRAWVMRLAGLGRRRGIDARVSEEMRFHVDRLAERYREAGCSPAEARRRALMAFGGLDGHREAARDELAAMSLDRLTGDARVALRMLARTPASTFTIIATLGICIGATTAMFSTVYGVLLRALPFQEPERLVWISSVRPDRSDAPFTLPELMDFQERARQSDIAGYGTWSAGWQTSDGVVRLQGMRLSANGFAILGLNASAGRLLEARDDEAAAPHVVVLGHGFWRNAFGGSPSVVGSTLRLNGEPFTVAGVMPEHFPWPLRGIDVVVPLVPDRDPLRYARSSVNFLRLFGRLTPAGSIAGAGRELTDITGDLRHQFPDAYATKIGVHATPMREYLVGAYRQQLLVILGCVVLMLGIGLANVVNLQSMRATARQGEIGVRRAIGASTGRLAAQLATEGLILAIAGGAVGVLIARWSLSLTGFARPLGVLRLDEVRLDAPSAVVMLGLTLLSAAVATLIPLGVALRTPPEAALRRSSRSLGAAAGQGRLRAGFVVAQVALALMLTFGTATLLESLRRLVHVDLGYEPDAVFVTRLSLPAQRYRQPADLATFYERLHTSLASMADVAADGMISVAPLSGALRSVNFSVAGVPTMPTERPLANYREISAGYFTAIRASMIAGRAFTEQDDQRATRVAIVSRALADRYLAGGAIGRDILVDDNNVGPRPVTVVGVVENLRHVTIDGQPGFDVYLPLRQVHPDGVTLVANSQFWVVRLKTDPARFDQAFRRTLGRVEPEAAMSGAETLRSYVDASLAPRRVSVALLTGCVLVALVLAVIGVHGVIAYGVQLQTRDLAVRLALGASSDGVVGFVLRKALLLAGAGIAIGTLGALVGAQALQGLAFGVAVRDPWLLVVAAAVLMTATTVASWIPARRAARIDPVVTLQSE